MKDGLVSVNELVKNNNKTMNNRAFGIVLIGGNYDAFNNGFDGEPKYVGGKYIASPFSIKYAHRDYWEKKNLVVLNRKSFTSDKHGNPVPRTLLERYEFLFGDIKNGDSEELVEEGKKEDKKKSKKNEVNRNEVIVNLMSCIDVINFGVTFATDIANFNSTGVIQYNYGVNLWEDAGIYTDMLLSPFRTKSKDKKNEDEEKSQSSLGRRSVLDKSFYCFDFNVNPMNAKKDLADNPYFSGYPRAAYEEFKSSALTSVTLLTSVAKSSCYNHLALFVELKENSLKCITNINQALSIKKDIQDEGNSIIDMTTIYLMLEEIKDDIESIELYYNKTNTTLVNESKSELINKTKMFSILNPDIRF